MINRFLQQTFRFGLACLLLFPSIGLTAGVLREEAVAYRVKGYKKQQQGDYVSAYTWYQKAIILDDTYPTPHNDLGVLSEQQGRMQEAEKQYQKALTLNPNYLEAHANLAMLYERMGEKEKAIYYWMKRYQLGEPGNPWTIRAEERLVSFGVLRAYPGIGSPRYAWRPIIEEQIERYEKTIVEFRALSEEHSVWRD